MPENIKVGNNGVVAKVDITFALAGINSTNCWIIFKVDNPNESFIPGRLINPILGFELDCGYYMVMKTVMDLTAYVVPPVGEVIITPVDPEYILANFTGADGTNLTAYTPEKGGIFPDVYGTWTIQNNKASFSGAAPVGGNWHVMSGILNHLDVKVTAVITPLNNAYVQLLFRASAFSNPYTVLTVALSFNIADRNMFINVVNTAAGVSTQISAVDVPGPVVNPGTEFTAICTLIGNAITVNINGTDYVTSLSIPAGNTNTRFGWGTANTSAAGDIVVNQFKVEDSTP